MRGKPVGSSVPMRIQKIDNTTSLATASGICGWKLFSAQVVMCVTSYSLVGLQDGASVRLRLSVPPLGGVLTWLVCTPRHGGLRSAVSVPPLRVRALFDIWRTAVPADRCTAKNSPQSAPLTAQTPDDGRETPSFKIADRKIDNLVKRLHDKNICPCCTARALAFHAASMVAVEMGSAEAIEMFERFIRQMREENIPAPDSMPSTEAH